jgi:hypothetical protein
LRTTNFAHLDHHLGVGDRTLVNPRHAMPKGVGPAGGESCTLPRMIAWIIIAVIAVPLVVFGFMATRRNTAASEHPASDDASANARTEQEFAEAEAFEAKWHEEDQERFHQERLP